MTLPPVPNSFGMRLQSSEPRRRRCFKIAITPPATTQATASSLDSSEGHHGSSCFELQKLCRLYVHHVTAIATQLKNIHSIRTVLTLVFFLKR